MTRIASIWLPKLAVERWAKTTDSPPDAPVVLVVEAAHGQLIHAATDAARERGARVGGRLTDARAIDPALIAEPADPDGDAALLQRLARWTGRWSPLVEVDGPDGLRLDVSGIAHLFGGEEALIADMEWRFTGLGLTARAAVAPTAGAAWALARFGPSPIAGEGLEELLAPLPVAALHLDSRSVQILQRLGLKTIGDLAKVPRKALQRRFREADNPLDALDRALGKKPEPLTAAPVDPPPRALLRLAEPATHPEVASQALGRLIPDLVRELERRRLGTRRLHLAGYRVDGSVDGTGVATAIPSRDPAHLKRLLADKVASLDPGFGFDGFALTASWTEDLGAAQESLVEEPDGTSEVARLVDRLSVKLGSGRVRRPEAVQSYLPERASGWRAAIENSPSPLCGRGRESRSGGRERGRAILSVTPSSSHPRLRGDGPLPPPQRGEGLKVRPQRLLDRPEAIAVVYATPEGLPRRFVWRKAAHDIARVEGPERIAPEWWRQPSTARLRDYYRVEDEAGRRYWIFREGLIGDGRGGAPNWYLHGIFG